MRNMEKREGRKPMGSLRKALSTAVLVAGMAILPSCATAPKSSMRLTSRFVNTKAKRDTKLDSQREKMRTVKGKPGETSTILDKLSKRLEKTITFVANKFGVKYKNYKKLLPVETRARIIRTGESISLWCGSPKTVVKIDSNGVSFSGKHYKYGEIHFQDDRMFMPLSNNPLGPPDFNSIMMVRKLPDGSAVLCLATPAFRMPHQ